MDVLRSALDRKKDGTHYSDRMQRILSVCQDCGILWHEERVTYRNGSSELKRLDDIEPAGTVLVTPQYEKYGLRVNPRVLNRLRAMAGQFAYALNVPAASVEVDGNVVYVRVPRPGDEAGQLVTFEQAWSIAPHIPLGSLLLGVDDDHRQLVIDLSSPTSVHAAVIGMTGSGKSTLMRTMILSAQRTGGSKVALFDPSGGFLPLSGHPSVWRGGLFRDAEACELGLEALTSALGRARHGLTYVFVDEVPDLVMQRPAIREHLARLAQSGRHAGIHLVLGAQHPLASDLGPLTMRNIPVRLVGKVADRTAAYHATGHSDSQAYTLRGRGDFVAVNGADVRRFQAAYVPEAFLRQWAARYPPRPPRLPVRTPTEVIDRGTRAAEIRSAGAAGRPMDDIQPFVVERIRQYILEHGEPPSSNWVYRFTKSELGSGGYNRVKARRAIEAAEASVGQT
jgi:energy-coupling factor transporter ATP-binding protein EcfA2